LGGSALVTTRWLADHLLDVNLAVVDLRWREDGSGRARYERSHVPGAVFVDWATDLVDPDDPIAFMLAGRDRFREVMERSGIGDDTAVVAYADARGSGPFRLWWACRAYGHDQVRILDGGFDKWVAEGRTVTAEPTRVQFAAWSPRSGLVGMAHAHDVAKAEHDTGRVVLDSRTAAQFRGEAVWFESGPVPADEDGIARTPRGEIRAGRVPWARNVPWHQLYRGDGTLKSPAELRELFADVGVTPRTKCITYCGVGLSASALLFALELAGVREAALYEGSWEEWGRDAARPVARGTWPIR
jgi:thiosulfate/3-mercaptopyruvate sulfurtransferase